MTAPVAVAHDSRRRVLVLAAVGAGLVLAVLLGSKVLAGGGGDDSATQASAARRPATTRTTVAAPATPEATQAPAETFEVFTTKNPFTPLRTVAAPAAAPARPAAAVATPAAVTATPVAVTTAPPAAAPAPAAVTTATGGQATEPTRAATRVALLDVFTEGDRTLANVRVNDTVSKVGAGDTFATNFRVVSLDAGERCGRFLFGDDQFRLCRGEEVLK